MINPCSFLRMRIQRNEVAWTNLKFESISQNRETYKKWVTLDVVNTLEDRREEGDILTSVSVTRSHSDMELFIFFWSVETHLFVAS